MTHRADVRQAAVKALRAQAGETVAVHDGYPELDIGESVPAVLVHVSEDAVAEGQETEMLRERRPRIPRPVEIDVTLEYTAWTTGGERALDGLFETIAASHRNIAYATYADATEYVGYEFVGADIEGEAPVYEATATYTVKLEQA